MIKVGDFTSTDDVTTVISVLSLGSLRAAAEADVNHPQKVLSALPLLLIGGKPKNMVY